MVWYLPSCTYLTEMIRRTMTMRENYSFKCLFPCYFIIFPHVFSLYWMSPMFCHPPNRSCAHSVGAEPLCWMQQVIGGISFLCQNSCQSLQKSMIGNSKQDTSCGTLLQNNLLKGLRPWQAVLKLLTVSLMSWCAALKQNYILLSLQSAQVG